MARKRLSVKLTQQEYDFLTDYVSHGQKNARYINRARILLLSHDGKDDQQIAQLLGVSRATVYNIRKRYHQPGHITEVLQDRPRRGRPVVFDSTVEANVAMIACSKAPEGATRWTLHLIADRLVRLNGVDSISHETVRNLLKKTGSSPGLMSNGVSVRSQAPSCGTWKMSCISILCPMIRCGP